MRNLSRLGLKLLGILLVYWTLSALCRALCEIPLLFLQWTPADNAALMKALRREGLASNIVHCILSGAFAAILLGRTDWIVSKFGLPEGPEMAPAMPPLDFLRVCLIVTGSVAIIYGVQGFPAALTMVIMRPHGLAGMSPDKSGLVATAKVIAMNTICEAIAAMGQFVLGWVVVLKSRTLASKAFAL